MVFFFLKKVIFLALLLMGAGISISSDSWFSAWFGLELNLMSFIPFIILKGDVYSSEASLKYFFVQALGSAIVVIGSFQVVLIPSFAVIMVVALLFKMGAAPLHFWLPQVMNGLNWVGCFVLMSAQKVAPMVLLSYIVSAAGVYDIIFWSSIMCALVGSLGGLNQVFLRKIMGFSSINHMSWLLIGMLLGESYWGVYFVFYVLVSASVLVIFYSQQVFHITQLSGSGWSAYTLVSYMSLLSLGGLPPFTGFVPKWLMIQGMVESGMILPLLALLVGTLISLYYYLRLTLLGLSMSSVKMKFIKVSLFGFLNMPLFMLFNFSGLFLPSLWMLV
uniref:NADH-ubiquinone oxidoreductase chain 2 n=1 Tax=Corallianassa coutierei TaxID=1267413 RepID=L0E7C0_CORCW|nr:NADH dehydrogenase subunit 2 [Corallianassa coutierei]AGA56167.1 NADH dehydrogenase subunit 2 [Corallianassa coutierei]